MKIDCINCKLNCKLLMKGRYNVKQNLRTFLLNRKIEILENLNALKTKCMGDSFTEKEIMLISVYEAQLKEVNETIKICNERGKY